MNARLADATEIRASSSSGEEALRCVVVVRKAGLEVGRLEESLHPEGTQRPTLDAIGQGRFIKPGKSVTPVSYLKAQSGPGEFIVQGKTLSYGESDLMLRASRGAVSVRVDGWNIEFAPPRGAALAAGEYANTKRPPFNNEFPGLEFTGHGRGSTASSGSFVIWEIAIEDDKVVHFAADFIIRSDGKGPPLCGMLRYKSSFQ